MEPEIIERRRRLVAALRSGEYQQCRHTMRRDGKHCCLGVAAELLAKETSIPFGALCEGSRTGRGLVCLNKKGQNYYGFGSDEQQRLSERNDNGMSFTDIANLIESHIDKEIPMVLWLGGIEAELVVKV